MGLRRLMLKNNIRRGLIFDYKIMQDVKSGDWYAWYRADIKTTIDDMMETSTVEGEDI